MSRTGANGDSSTKGVDRDDPRLTALATVGVHGEYQQRQRSKKIAIAGTSLLLLGTLAACSNSEDNVADQPSQSAYSQALSDTGGLPSGTNGDSTDNAPHSSTESASDLAKNNNLCRTEELDVSVSDQQGAAGSTLFDIVFKNTGSNDCVLRGYPGVSMVTDSNGTQLGASAEREKTKDIPVVTLPAGDKAFAPVRVTNVAALDPAECRSSTADGIRVYPPDETRSAYVRVNGLEGCAGKPKFMTVQPVQTDRTR